MENLKVKDLIQRLQCLDPEAGAWFYLGRNQEDLKNIAYTILNEYEEQEMKGIVPKGLPINLLINNFSFCRDGGVPEHLSIEFKPNFHVPSYAKQMFDTNFVHISRVHDPEKDPNLETDGVVEIDGIKIQTRKESMESCNILSVEAGTTGLMGGDTGHGGRTYLRISDDASTDMRCIVKTDDGKTHKFDGVADVVQIEIILGGDTELDTFIDALEFAAKTLRSQK